MKIKATVSKKRRARGALIMWLVGILCFVAIVGIVYNIIVPNYWFVASYIIGILLGGSYILVTMNELYSTWLFTDGYDLCMRCWDNCFFPHQTLTKPKFIAELTPAKNKKLRVPIEEISKLYIGTKTFLKRNTDNEAFLEAVAFYENTKFNANQRMLEKMDILYVETYDGESVFMCVADFEAKEVMRLVHGVEKVNPAIDIKLSGRKYRRYGTPTRR